MHKLQNATFREFLCKYWGVSKYHFLYCTDFFFLSSNIVEANYFWSSLKFLLKGGLRLKFLPLLIIIIFAIANLMVFFNEVRETLLTEKFLASVVYLFWLFLWKSIRILCWFIENYKSTNANNLHHITRFKDL